jgi:hypothetical protein
MYQAMRRATSWYPGESMCVFIVSMRDRVLRQKLQGTKDADKFLFANGILQVRCNKNNFQNDLPHLIRRWASVFICF